MKKKLPLLLSLASLLIGAQQASAIINVNANEDSGNVVFSFSGSVDLASVDYLYEVGNLVGAVIANEGLMSFEGSMNHYSLADFSGPTNFGAGGYTVESSSSGDAFLFWASLTRIGLPLFYVSGSSISGSMTFNSKTFASMDLTPGTYDWSWSKTTDEVVSRDSLRLTIDSVSVPDTGTTVALLGLALTGLAFVRRRFA